MLFRWSFPMNIFLPSREREIDLSSHSSPIIQSLLIPVYSSISILPYNLFPSWFRLPCFRLFSSIPFRLPPPTPIPTVALPPSLSPRSLSLPYPPLNSPKLKGIIIYREWQLPFLSLILSYCAMCAVYGDWFPRWVVGITNCLFPRYRIPATVSTTGLGKGTILELLMLESWFYGNYRLKW